MNNFKLGRLLRELLILFGVKIWVKYIPWNILIWVSIKWTGNVPNQPCVVHDLFFHPTSSTVTRIHLTVKGLLTRANPSVFGFLKCFKAIFPTVGVWHTRVSFLPRWLFFLFNFKIWVYFQGNAVHMFLIYLCITHKNSF